MYKKILLIIAAFLLISNVALAIETAQIELSISNNEVAVGDSFQVSMQLKSASTGNLNISSVDIPGIENFGQQGSSQSTRMQMINGATTATTETLLTLVATKEGDFQIGPIQIDNRTNKVTSNFVNVKVGVSKSKALFNSTNSISTNLDANALRSSDKKPSSSGQWIKNTLALLVLFGLLYAFFKQKQFAKTEKNGGENVEIKTSNSLAKNLPDLDDEKYFEKTKEFLLDFIEKKYNIKTDTLTSQEIGEELSRKNVSNRVELVKALSLCDQGRFAFNESGKEELRGILERIG